jgi:hypothetical protein
MMSERQLQSSKFEFEAAARVHAMSPIDPSLLQPYGNFIVLNNHRVRAFCDRNIISDMIAMAMSHCAGSA